MGFFISEVEGIKDVNFCFFEVSFIILEAKFHFFFFWVLNLMDVVVSCSHF